MQAEAWECHPTIGLKRRLYEVIIVISSYAVAGRSSGKQKERKTVRIAVGASLATVWIASAIQLVQSCRLAVETAYTRSDLPGYLVSEWIGESLHNVELILHESLAGLDASNLSSSSRTDEENRAINQALARRAAMHGHIVFLGLFDRDCVIQFGSIASIIGDSSADLGRDYCEEVRKPPFERLKLSGFFVSSTGEMNVSATYPLISDDGEVIGFALAGLDLSFFQRWLDEFGDPSGEDHLLMGLIASGRREAIRALIGLTEIVRRISKLWESSS